MSDEVIAGLEIHQQLDTKKLFCDCRSELVEDIGNEFLRRLRPTQSEMGEIDRAAMVQAEKKLKYRYQSPHHISCLVDDDEEPPHLANPDAIEVVLTIASMLNANIVDEIHFMRKIVVDGSNTTGFQRTALVAMDGKLEVNGRVISLSTFCLEEDAARKVETKSGEITYRLDRLGIPLIELATGPDMRSPEEVKEVAQRLGSIMRATRRVKRGIGTIREDLNVSIPGGARVEIKGVQELRLLPTYVVREMERQRNLLTIKSLLLERKVPILNQESTDLTELFANSQSKVIASSLKKGGRVLAVPLAGFSGLLKSADGKMRLGAEMAQRARTKGVKGIFHSDELPGYGIEEATVEEIKIKLNLSANDAFVICADEEGKALAALQASVERALEAFKGVPEETRDPQPDGSSTFSRPLPGAARMYPETDVPPITIDQERRNEIRESLPELPEVRMERVSKQYGIHAQQARQLVKEGFDDLFEEIATNRTLAPIAARTFLNTFPELERQGVETGKISDDTIKEVFTALASGEFAKEALPEVLKHIAQGKSAEQAVHELGISTLSSDEASIIVARIVREKGDLIREKGMGAVGPLMGVVMSELRGKIDGRAASEILKSEIKRYLSAE